MFECESLLNDKTEEEMKELLRESIQYDDFGFIGDSNLRTLAVQIRNDYEEKNMFFQLRTIMDDLAKCVYKYFAIKMI